MDEKSKNTGASSFLVVGTEMTAPLKQSILDTTKDMKERDRALTTDEEDQYTKHVVELKVKSKNDFKQTQNMLKKKIQEIGLNEIKGLTADVLKKLEEAEIFTQVTSQRSKMISFKSECNALEGLRNYIGKQIDEVYNTFSEMIDNCKISPIKKKKDIKESQKYIEEVLALLAKIEGYADSFSQKMQEHSTRLDELASTCTIKRHEIEQAKECLTEVIIPELARKVQWELFSSTMAEGYQRLIDKETHAKKLFLDLLRPTSAEERLLPEVFIAMLANERLPEEEVSVESWESLGDKAIALPAAMQAAYARQANCSHNMIQFERDDAELRQIEEEIAREEELARRLENETAELIEQIEQEFRRASKCNENFDIEKAEVGQLTEESLRLSTVRAQQLSLNKQKMDSIAVLENQIRNLKIAQQKAIDEAEKEYRKNIEDFGTTQQTSYNKKAELLELKAEVEALEKKRNYHDKLVEFNQKKMNENDQLDAEWTFLQEKKDLLRKAVEEARKKAK